jgi:acetolactate synthase-1/2/3 large subunit
VRAARAVAEALAELGSRHVFGLLGSGNFELTNALVSAGVGWTAARHEGGAVVMTDAWSRVTGEIGLCSVHQGPGLTNTVTGLAEAAKSRTSMLVLAADSPPGALRSNFRIDQRGLAESVGALQERLTSAETAVSETVRAWTRARDERRPVVLSLPIDVQAAEVAGPSGLAAPPPAPAPSLPDQGELERVAGWLAQADRPLLIAGRGAARIRARAPIERLAGRCGALLATSAVANGLFSGNPWCLGISGGFASPLAAELIRRADVVVSFGATLNMWTTRHGRLLADAARVVQVDVEAEAIGAHHRVDAGLAGDAAAVAEALLDLVPERSGWRSEELRAEIARRGWRSEPFTDAGDGGRIDPRTLSIALDRLLPLERTVTVDSGHFLGWPSMYWRVPDERGFVFSQAFQAVGLGLATAIGAALARPDRLCVAALGDGGFLMGLSELETVVRIRLPLLIVVYNDAAYGAEVHHFGPEGHDLDLVRFPDTDLAAVARGIGAEALTVRRAEDLEPLAAWLAAPRGPLVVDAKVVPEVVGEWLPEAFGH